MKLSAAACREQSSDGASTSGNEALQASIPLRLQLTGSASGNPDLRLQLLSFRYGTACQSVPRHPVDHHNAFVSGRRSKGLYISCQPVSCTCNFEHGSISSHNLWHLMWWLECYTALGFLSSDAGLHSLQSHAMQAYTSSCICDDCTKCDCAKSNCGPVCSSML